MKRVAALFLGLFLLGTAAGIACWPEVRAAQEPAQAVPTPDVDAAIILVRNFTKDTIPLFIVAQNHSYQPLGYILPRSSGILVLPSSGLVGLRTIAIFFVLDGEPVSGGMIERLPAHVSLLQFAVGEPEREI